MFLCRVVVGDWCHGKNGQLTPDTKVRAGGRAAKYYALPFPVSIGMLYANENGAPKTDPPRAPQPSTLELFDTTVNGRARPLPSFKWWSLVVYS